MAGECPERPSSLGGPANLTCVRFSNSVLTLGGFFSWCFHFLQVGPFIGQSRPLIWRRCQCLKLPRKPVGRFWPSGFHHFLSLNMDWSDGIANSLLKLSCFFPLRALFLQVGPVLDDLDRWFSVGDAQKGSRFRGFLPIWLLEFFSPETEKRVKIMNCLLILGEFSGGQDCRAGWCGDWRCPGFRGSSAESGCSEVYWDGESKDSQRRGRVPDFWSARTEGSSWTEHCMFLIIWVVATFFPEFEMLALLLLFCLGIGFKSCWNVIHLCEICVVELLI